MKRDYRLFFERIAWLRPSRRLWRSMLGRYASKQNRDAVEPQQGRRRQTVSFGKVRR